MAVLQIKTSNGTPVTIAYPAERVPDGTVVRCRVGKKNVLPAFGDESLQHLVQVRLMGRVSMLLVRDVLQTRFWDRIRNAYNILGQMQIEAEVKLDRAETARVVQWLKEQRLALGYYEG